MKKMLYEQHLCGARYGFAIVAGSREGGPVAEATFEVTHEAPSGRRVTLATLRNSAAKPVVKWGTGFNFVGPGALRIEATLCSGDAGLLFGEIL